MHNNLIFKFKFKADLVFSIKEHVYAFQGRLFDLKVNVTMLIFIRNFIFELFLKGHSKKEPIYR